MRLVIINQLLRLYRGLLRLYPGSFYADYSELMCDIARQMLLDAVNHSGWLGLMHATVRLVLDTAVNIPREHAQEYKEILMSWSSISPHTRQRIIYGLIFIILGLVVLPLIPLLGTLQLIAIVLGPLPLLLSTWWIRHHIPHVSKRVWVGVAILGVLGPILRTSEWLFSSQINELSVLFGMWWISFGVGGILLGLILIIRSMSQVVGLPAFPIGAVLLALLAHVSDMDYFTFEMSWFIRLLPLLAIPTMISWWLLIERRERRKSGILVIWMLTLFALLAANLYGRHVLAGTDHFATYAPLYTLVSITTLWIASVLPDPPTLDQTSPEPNTGYVI